MPSKHVIAPLLAALVAVPLMLAPAAQAAPFWSKPTAQEMKQLERGEILLGHTQLPGTTINEFTAVGIVNAPWEKTLRYYADPANTKKFQTAIRKLDIIERTGEYKRKAAYEISLPWPIGGRHFTLDVWAVPQDKYIEWKLINGNVKEQRGSYAITPLSESRSLVSYRIAVDLDTWVPTPVIGFVQKRTIPDVIRVARRDLDGAH